MVVVAAGILVFSRELIVKVMLPTMMIFSAIVVSVVASIVVVWLSSLLDPPSGGDVPRLPSSALGDNSNPLWDREMDS